MTFASEETKCSALSRRLNKLKALNSAIARSIELRSAKPTLRRKRDRRLSNLKTKSLAAEQTPYFRTSSVLLASAFTNTVKDAETPNDPSSAAPEQWRGSCPRKVNLRWSCSEDMFDASSCHDTAEVSAAAHG